MSEAKPTAFEKEFRAFTKKVLAVPKEEIEKRETEYRRSRKDKKAK